MMIALSNSIWLMGQSVPNPVVSVVQPTCINPTGSIQITQPINNPYSDLFISEVTDHEFGSHSYVEIYNGTGAAVNLSNYEIRIHNNGGSSPNAIAGLSGVLASEDTYVLQLSTNTSHGGITPNQICCNGVNENDNIRLTDTSGNIIDLWGDVGGSNFIPDGDRGYVFRRKPDVTAPSAIFNIDEWTFLDASDYSDVDNFDSTRCFEYSIDGGMNFSDANIFNALAPGNYEVIARFCGTTTLSSTTNVTLFTPEPPESGDIDGQDEMCVGDIQDLTLNNAESGGTWISSDTALATVSNGTVTAIASGNVTITYQITEGSCQTQTDFDIQIHELPITSNIIIN